MTEPSKIFAPESMATAQAPRNKALVLVGARVLRIISATALGLAVSSAIMVVTLRILHCFQPQLFPWSLKSAVPLILIGIAFACLQFVVSRNRVQILLGLLVALAFILWGTEQFLSNPGIISFIDDFVVFLFVLDLGIVIYGHLKPGPHAGSSELPFDSPDK